MKTYFLKELLRRPLVRHAAILALALVIFAAYLAVTSYAKETVRLEAENFFFDKSDWKPLEDVNLSNNRGVMTLKKGALAIAPFRAPREGNYTVWFRYFGNYGKPDLALWKRAYTNNFGYLDYFGGLSAQDISIRVDNHREIVIKEDGSHRYIWAHSGEFNLSQGVHLLSVWKTDNSAGSANLDSVIITDDPRYAPGRASLRDISGYIGPLLIAAFPVIVWLVTRKEADLRPYANVCLMYSAAISAVLSVLWIDADGGFWIWLTQNGDFTVSGIYSGGEALHHRYVYPPPVALMLIGLRAVFSLFGATDGITPLSLLLSKLIIFPFVIGTGIILFRLEGACALLLWALNSFVIFTVAANSMYFGLAFLLTLCLYFIKKDNSYACAASLGAALAFMSAAALVTPPFLLLLRRSGNLKKIIVLAALVLLPGFLIFLPYSLIDPVSVNTRVMGAGISTWMSMHLGLRLGDVGITSFLYAALLAYLWIKRPPLDYQTLSSVFAATALIYFHVGSPFFFAWTVAFQPFIIAWAARHKYEFFYSIHITAMMVWGSFYQNTGGAGDRAGETGFFPYYVFYTWPFDIYRFFRLFYRRIDLFSQGELETMAHSLSAGVSAVLLALIFLKLTGSEKLTVRDCD